VVPGVKASPRPPTVILASCGSTHGDGAARGVGSYSGAMTDAWTWTYLDADGRELRGERLPTTAFPSQSDAENWFGESWHDLAEAGVDAVNLHLDGALVYGPMSLRAAQ
jgi:hypothetical protein